MGLPLHRFNIANRVDRSDSIKDLHGSLIIHDKKNELLAGVTAPQVETENGSYLRGFGLCHQGLLCFTVQVEAALAGLFSDLLSSPSKK